MQVKEKAGMNLKDGHKHRVISAKELKHYIGDLGWEYVNDLGNKEAIGKLPNRLLLQSKVLSIMGS